ncbi:hypothetical protein PGN35_018330 [Nodosilinea sp. PGN35]|uniref:hypothetical protein n=1 Tax=Nodosilinea sp. PGN35 TaxID=3020489 RepID=UPI0023B3135B|nr:hypothetical protein [Nodosilinea sp. TSF1-S3]MDF0364713.1 hypothetical protein [Nodosilinea sp. TSF1-S3]
MPSVDQQSKAKSLGAGRSGQVFLIEIDGQPVARKIFSGDTLAAAVHYVLFGADNPYIWNEDVLQCAYYRRKILEHLVEYWFGEKLKIANAIAAERDAELRQNQLDAVFIAGRSPALRQPLDLSRSQEVKELTDTVMQPLQRRLVEAGLDGLVWQAGKGNPVALNNFLIVDGKSGDRTFVWIDMESGVPALFPLNVLTLFTFYLPKCIEYRTFLFDDVSIKTLSRYVCDRRLDLERQFGALGYQQLEQDIQALGHHQQQWRSLNRLKRGIFSHLQQGKITPQAAERYQKYPPLWLWYILWQMVVTVIQTLLIDLPQKVVRKVAQIPVLRLTRNLVKLIVSKRYRTQVARDYITARIEVWGDRKQLTEAEAEQLLTRLDQESGTDYLSDFGVHLGMKVFVKIVEYGIFPLIYLAGYINELTLGIVILLGGAFSRTVYTGFRMVQAAAEGKEIPWLAFFVGMIPLMIGNIAYPCQMLYSAAGKRGKVAGFIVYDIFTRIGGWIPIWGGEDTLTEHYFNHSASNLLRFIGRLQRANA